jgi:oxygen-independent coproporphyrinogen-3 oxidase
MRCRHNLNYWEFGDYLGIGAGAHGKVSFPDRVERHARAKQPREYMEAAAQGASAVENRVVQPRELPFEFMLNALRLVDGLPRVLFAERTGLPAAAIDKELRVAQAKGLLEVDEARIRPTARGRLFLNDLVALFLPAVK